MGTIGGKQADRSDSGAATLEPTAELMQLAAHIRTCVKCLAPFVHDFEEARCPSCVARLELHR